MRLTNEAEEIAMATAVRHQAGLSTPPPGRGLRRGEREEAFFPGAYVTNLAIAQGLVMVLAVIPTIIMLNANPDSSLVPVFIGGLVGAVLAPLFFYPHSKTFWVAIELTLRPIDEAEPSDVRPDRTDKGCGRSAAG